MQGEEPVGGYIANTSGHIQIQGYDIDSDKENHEDAVQVLRVCQVAEGMGHGRGEGRRGGGGVAETEEGPIRLYHPWSAHSIAVQTDSRARSPVPNGFEPNLGPAYIPFHIINKDGHTIPAKYVKVQMTNDPYAYGMINSEGEVFKGLIHTAPVLNITHVPHITSEDLVSLHFNYLNASRINNALAHVGDQSLVAEVHQFRHIKKRFTELEAQMKILEEEMWMLQTRQRQCVGCLEKADILRHIDKEHGQDIHVVPSCYIMVGTFFPTWDKWG